MENGDNAAAPLPGVVNWIRRMSTGAAPAEEGLSEAILGRGSSPLPNATLRAASPTGAGATLHGPHGSGLSPPSLNRPGTPPRPTSWCNTRYTWADAHLLAAPAGAAGAVEVKSNVNSFKPARRASLTVRPPPAAPPTATTSRPLRVGPSTPNPQPFTLNAACRP